MRQGPGGPWFASLKRDPYGEQNDLIDDSLANPSLELIESMSLLGIYGGISIPFDAL